MDLNPEMSESPSESRSGPDRDPAEVAERSESKMNGESNGVAAGAQKTVAGVNAKDPSRPRRKKARRACFACQRAHLTCGDERPCQRCIKRGLQDACHDGVRKKAKYLHDAPDGALMAGVGGNFYSNPIRSNSSNGSLPMSRNGTNAVNPAVTQQTSGAAFYAGPQSASYSIYQDSPIGQSPFTTTQSPVSPSFALKTSTTPQNPALPASMGQQPPSVPVSGAAATPQNPFAGPFFDPSDPALFNFDLSSMNFENRYGALEFGMLGHMATGAGDSPSDSATQRGSMGRSGSAQFSSTTPAATFGESPHTQPQQPFMFGDPLLNEWSSGQPGSHVTVGGGVYPTAGQNNNNNLLTGHMSKPDAPHAFAIESGPTNFTSPDTTASSQVQSGFEDTAFTPPISNKSNGLTTNGQRQQQQQQPQHQHQQQRPVISTPNLKHQTLQVTGTKRRHRNPSAIYESVREPYAYTSGFHSLTAFIQRRFSPQKTLQIAKALASIRPSFIATTKTLNRDDLIFMEKCFQRTLWEYEDFINACGTPTIVCRRTGEIAAVGKEFSILTGWKKDVLLGKESNMNVNTGGSAASRGSFTPRSTATQDSSSGAAPPGSSSSRPQPVFLAELLDDESVVEFYEDFARLAFGDSRGSVMNTCKLLKYKTKEDMEVAQSMDEATNGASQQQKWNAHLRKGGIAGEAGMNQLGFKDGKVECAYCWTVKRDVFDIPMLIVMNFLPCI